MPPRVTHKLTEQRRALPDQPGVYLFRDEKGRVIYVGKARSLKKRVASHFSGRTRYGPAELVPLIDAIETTVTATEAEALLLEQNFIKQYKPRFNIRLRDDKSYPYIAISLDEEFPRVYFTRERHRRNRAYFGPYSNAKKVRGTLDLLQKVFLFRSCDGPEPGRRSGSPCLDYYIKRCEAPCVGYVDREQYRRSIDGVTAFLSGRYKEIELELTRRMNEAAEAQEFEQAALYRNRLRAVRSLLERQRVANESVGTVDAVAVAAEGPDANAQVFQVRDGVLSDRQSFYLANEGRAPAARGRGGVRAAVATGRPRRSPRRSWSRARWGRCPRWPTRSRRAGAHRSRCGRPSAATSGASSSWPSATPPWPSTRSA